MQRVAVVGAGPGGLVVSRYLKQEGFEPVNLRPERAARRPVGRDTWYQWRMAVHADQHEPHHDLVQRSATRARHRNYPTNQQMYAYLTRYATESGLLPHLQLGTRVEEITRDGEGWKVRTRKKDGVVTEETFPKVVIASGRYSKPSIPAVPGLDTFSGKGGVSHTYEYRNLKWSPDWKILVAGCGISALEIAGDLAMLGVSRVVSSSRKQRYVLLKLIAGAPAEHVGLTRFAALAAEAFPMEDVGRMFKNFVVSHCRQPRGLRRSQAARKHLRGWHRSLAAFPSARRRRPHSRQAMDRRGKWTPGPLRGRHHGRVRRHSLRYRLPSSPSVPRQRHSRRARY